ncbi:MAG: hypothetical protein PVSMB7_05580 [Chloroflexota bacterium]
MASSDGSATLERLGFFMRDRRHALHLTQTQLAERLGWVQERISLLERGKYGLPSLPALARIAVALESSLPELLHAAGFLDTALPRQGESGGTDPAGIALLYTMQRILAIEAPGLKEALDQVSDVISEVMGADKVNAFLHDPSIASLVAVGASNTSMGRKQEQIGMDRLPIANGGREVEVFETGLPFQTGRARNDPGMLVGFAEGLNIGSVLAVPLYIGGNRRGVLVVTSTEEDHFTEIEIPFFDAVARWVGLLAHRAEIAEAVTAGAAAAASSGVADEMSAILTRDLHGHLVSAHHHLDALNTMLQDKGLPDCQTEALEAANKIRRAQSVLDGLADAVHLQQRLGSLDSDEVDLTDLMQGLAADVGADGTPIEVRAATRLIARVDRDRILKAMRALVTNAFQHAPGGAPVVVTLKGEMHVDGQWAVITVHDDGPGMDRDIFPSSSHRHLGTSGDGNAALDLFMARVIAEAHGGTLTEETKSGGGSTFRLSIPVDNDDSSLSRAVQSPVDRDGL